MSFWRWFWVVLIGVPVLAFTVWGLADNTKRVTGVTEDVTVVRVRRLPGRSSKTQRAETE